MSSGFFHFNSLNRFIFSIKIVSGYLLLLSCFVHVERSERNANSVDPDLTPRSDLGLYCLSMFYETLRLYGFTHLCRVDSSTLIL